MPCPITWVRCWRSQPYWRVWAVLPFTLSLVGADLDVGVLYVVAIGGLGEIAVVLSGWGSNNKYALLAAFRSVAQLLSYEVPLVIALLVPVMLSGSLSLNGIVRGQTVPYILLAPVAAFMFFLTSIAEVGRSPFDLTEAESELVAGFNLEYSGLKFGMFYVADFLHAFTISLLFAVLFLGGWHGPFAEQYPMLGLLWFLLKAGVVYFLGVWMRVSFPRFRIDQMMAISWKMLNPAGDRGRHPDGADRQAAPGRGPDCSLAHCWVANLVLVVPPCCCSASINENDR